MTCVLAMRHIVEAQPPLPVQAGVSWGPVFTAGVGPPYRKWYAVMGDTVNVAARLEGLRCSSVQPADPRAFATAIEEALDHGRSPAARRAVAPLSTERTARRLLTIYAAASSWPI